MNIGKEELEIVKITCTDTGITSEAEIWKRHPNGDISMLIENTIKMHFKKYNGNVWTCEMIGKEFVYDIRQQN
tara:strand:- start:5119 stop:5337 length:219 start_codon:yes stop_codon:yes gene_type:complete